MEYDNELRGVLFRNDRKDKESQPDHKGNCQIDGVEYWISAWVNVKPSDGGKYFRIQFQRKDEQPAKEVPAQAENEFDDDLPF